METTGERSDMMPANREWGFEDVEKFLLRLALLLLLTIGLAKIVAPEVKAVLQDITGDNATPSELHSPQHVTR